MAMIERVIVLPTKDNDGVSLARETASVKREILAIAGGYSAVKQVGVWTEDGKEYRDTSERIHVTCDESQDASIASRLPVWAGLLRQICLYTHASEIQADFVYSASQEIVTAQ